MMKKLFLHHHAKLRKLRLAAHRLIDKLFKDI
ncbi:MAG: hypothetical protein ACD_75C02255G0001, partial [uncultured bacterium]